MEVDERIVLGQRGRSRECSYDDEFVGIRRRRLCTRRRAPGDVVMSDVSGRKIANHGAKNVEMVLEDGGHLCQARFPVADVARMVLSAGKLVNSGRFGLDMDACGSWLAHKNAGERLRVEHHGNTFYVRANVACVLSAEAEAARLESVEQAMRADLVPSLEVEHRPPADPVPDEPEEDVEQQVMEDLRGHTGAPEVDCEPIRTPTGSAAWSVVAAMRQRLQQLGGAINGAKEELWKRLLKCEDEAMAEELEDRRKGVQ